MATRPTRQAKTGKTDVGVHLVRGDDPSLIGQAVHELLGELVGERDAAMVVEEHGGPGTPDLDIGVIIDAVTTPPFITDRRVVVVRDAGRLVAAEAGRLVPCLENPIPGVVLVLVAGGGTVPAALVKAVDRVGNVVDTAVGTGRARTQWLVDRLHDAPVRLDVRAATRLGDHLGGDLSRVQGLLDTLAAAYGPGAAIDTDQLEPFLGEAGSGGAVGPDRRHRRRRHRRRAGGSGAAARARWFPSPGRAVDPPPSLSGHVAARRRRRDVGRAGRHPPRHQERLPGPQGTRARSTDGPGPARAGGHPVGRG